MNNEDKEVPQLDISKDENKKKGFKIKFDKIGKLEDKVCDVGGTPITHG